MLHQEVINKIPLYELKDDETLSVWWQLPYKEKTYFRYDHKFLEQTLVDYRGPVITTRGLIEAAGEQDCSKVGFWSKLECGGGAMPQSRDNSTMIHHIVNGTPHLTLFGGIPPNFGIH